MDLEKIKKIAGITETIKPIHHTVDILTEHMRRIAGLPLFEAVSEDDDDDSEDDKLPKRRVAGNFGNMKVPEKAKAEAEAEKEKEAEKPTEKRASQSKEFVGPKKKGKAENPGSKSGGLRDLILSRHKEGLGTTPKVAHSHLEKLHSEGKYGTVPTMAGTTTMLYNAKRNLENQGLIPRKDGTTGPKEIKEAWLISHPMLPSHFIYENRELNQFQWVSNDDNNRFPMIFETEEAVEEVARYLRDFRNQSVIIEHVILDN